MIMETEYRRKYHHDRRHNLFKAPQIKSFLQKVFSKEAEQRKRGLCATCGKPVVKELFKDTVSYEEFLISGLCQQCQDSVFGD